jgi:hypothetical protein
MKLKNNFVKSYIKSSKKIIFYILILFSTYCASIIGFSWDEGYLNNQGKVTANYLLSLGFSDPEYFFRREFYSPIYSSFKYLIVQAFPMKFHVEAGHLVNLFFSVTAIIGLKKICEDFFNKDVGVIVFLILFFFPAFFGHMGFNSKDTIIAFCHVWIFYLAIRYLKSHKNSYIYYISLLAAVGTGLNLFFLGSLLPLIILFLLEIFYFKRFNRKEIKIKKYLIDFLKGFLIFYFFLVLFWIDTHPNIFILPFKFLYEWAFSDLWRGYHYILVNGDYYLYADIPKSYLFTNIIYKSPEYFLLTYIIFFGLFINYKSYFTRKFKFFNYKMIWIFSIIVYPFVLLYFTPFSIYDGLRHVLWMLPYLCIIPALTIYFLFKNLKKTIVKLASSILLIFTVFFVFNFLSITPYQYTYLNILNGNKKNNIKKFENDYWGASLKELVNKIDFDKNKKMKIATCGVSHYVPKYYLKKREFTNFEISGYEDSDYIIITNRATMNLKNKKLLNCFDKHDGEEIFHVSRNGVILSSFRKTNK